MSFRGFILAVRAAAAAFLLSFAVSASIAAPEQPADLEHVRMHVGITVYAFRNVNPSDAEVAFRVFARTVGRQKGYETDTGTHLFTSAEACEGEIRKGGLNLVILDAFEYLGMDIPDMEPAFVHYEPGFVIKDYLLLTRRGSGLNTLADLRDKDVAVLSSKSGSVSMTWLEVLLLEHGMGTPEAYFKKVEVVVKPSMTVLPVFFGRKPACVVDRLSFQTMVELNPQVGESLVAIAVSEPLLDSVTCITRTAFDSEDKCLDFMQSLQDLHLNPAGRQILMMFKVDRLVPFKEEYLEGVRNLHNRCAELKSTEPSQRLIPAVTPSPTAQTDSLATIVHDRIRR